MAGTSPAMTITRVIVHDRLAPAILTEMISKFNDVRLRVAIDETLTAAEVPGNHCASISPR
jgi:hypothetical protein